LCIACHFWRMLVVWYSSAVKRALGRVYERLATRERPELHVASLQRVLCWHGYYDDSHWSRPSV